MSLWSRRLQRRDPVSGWFARIRSGNIDAREDKVFTDWLESDAGNEGRLENCDLAWGLMSDLADRPQVSRLIEEAVREVGGAPRLRGWRPTRWAVAAVASIAVLIGGLAWVSIFNRVSTAEYATQVGEQRTVDLEDGSKVTLNTATHLKVRFSRKWRSVELLEGEALFAVHPDTQRPFVVLALGGVTTAVGTEFAVQLGRGSADVSVLEGTVTVAPLVPIPSREPVRITVGQAVSYDVTGASGDVRSADATRIRAWQANRILFSNERLADAIEEYNRYTTTPLILEAPDLADRRVDGLFRVGEPEAFIHALESALPLRDRRSPDAITLIPR